MAEEKPAEALHADDEKKRLWIYAIVVIVVALVLIYYLSWKGYINLPFSIPR